MADRVFEVSHEIERRLVGGDTLQLVAEDHPEFEPIATDPDIDTRVLLGDFHGSKYASILVRDALKTTEDPYFDAETDKAFQVRVGFVDEELEQFQRGE